MVLLLPSQGQAISHRDTESMTCEHIQILVREQGETILRFNSSRGRPRYERYVAHAGYCRDAQHAQTGWVPTADRPSCPVLRCVPGAYEER